MNAVLGCIPLRLFCVRPVPCAGATVHMNPPLAVRSGAEVIPALQPLNGSEVTHPLRPSGLGSCAGELLLSCCCCGPKSGPPENLNSDAKKMFVKKIPVINILLITAKKNCAACRRKC